MSRVTALVAAASMLAASATFVMPAEAAVPIVQPQAITAPSLPVEKSTYFYPGRPLCFYRFGWHGPGLYRCRGFGYGYGFRRFGYGYRRFGYGYGYRRFGYRYGFRPFGHGYGRGFGHGRGGFGFHGGGFHGGHFGRGHFGGGHFGGGHGGGHRR